MDDKRIRERIHRAVDAYGAPLQDDPFLAQRILAANRRKEGPRMKKLSTGMIIAIVLTLLSVTAVAVGLSIEQVWQQAFDKMGTWGEVWNIGEPTEEDLTMEEAAAIGRKTIKEKFGVTDEELDAMGFYPSYFAAEVDDGEYYPADWRFLWSSKTNTDIAKDDYDHGPNGEYRVYMDAITGEIETCIFYTTDFWRYAQRIWDVGNYDEVYRNYKKDTFYTQTIEQQRYWKNLLLEQGYELIKAEEQGVALLKSAYLELLYMEPSRILDPAKDMQAAAAWAAVEKTYNYNPNILQKHGYVAIRSHYETGTEDIFLVFNYNAELNTTTMWADRMASDVKRVGAFIVSFQPGSTEVASIGHMLFTDWNAFSKPVFEGELYEKSDWNSEDLLAFSAAFEQMDRAMKRMSAAGCSNKDMESVARDFIHRLGGSEDYYPAAPEEANVMQWFQDKSEWDAKIPETPMTYEDSVAKYGSDQRFWPQEVMIVLDPRSYRMPNEGERSFEAALTRALDQLAKERGTADLTGFTVNIQRVSLTDDPDKVDCRWQVFVADDPKNVQKGWKINFGEWEDHIDVPYIQDIMDPGNG